MAIIGNPILLSGGNSSLLNLPITVTQEEPVPERVGHLWIKLDNADNITKVEINNTVNPNAENGTLQLIPLNYDDKLNFAQYINVNGKKVLATMTTASDSNKWAITDESKGDTYCQFVLGGYPLVYSKINGILQNETAYVWTGEKWKLVSDNCSYWIGSTESNGLSVYHYVDGEILAKEFSFNNTATNNKLNVTTDATYTWFAVYNETIDIYKRVGSVFTLIQQLPSTLAVSGYNRDFYLSENGFISGGYRFFKFSADAQYIYVQYFYNYNSRVVVYKYNKSSDLFEKLQVMEIGDGDVQIFLNEYNEFITRELASGANGHYMRYYVIDKETGLYYEKFYIQNQLLNNGSLSSLYNVHNTCWLIGRTIILWPSNEAILNFIDLNADTLTKDNYTKIASTELLKYGDYVFRDNVSIVHPNKRHLLISTANTAAEKYYGVIYIVDKETGKVTNWGSDVTPICFNPDGTILYIQDSTSAIKKYDVTIDEEGNFSLSNGTIIVSNATSISKGNLFIPSSLRD